MAGEYFQRLRHQAKTHRMRFAVPEWWYLCEGARADDSARPRPAFVCYASVLTAAELLAVSAEVDGPQDPMIWPLIAHRKLEDESGEKLFPDLPDSSFRAWLAVVEASVATRLGQAIFGASAGGSGN